jgi:hypothetical protein
MTVSPGHCHDYAGAVLARLMRRGAMEQSSAHEAMREVMMLTQDREEVIARLQGRLDLPRASPKLRPRPPILVCVDGKIIAEAVAIISEADPNNPKENDDD